jgi:hypothetical protein
VVHEILAHAGEIDLARDAVLLQFLASSDSRAHEDGGTAVCSSRDDDLLSRVECARRPISQLSDDAGCSEPIGTLFEHDAVDGGVCLDGHVIAMIFLGDVVRCSGPNALVYCSRHVAASMGYVAGAEHVVV